MPALRGQAVEPFGNPLLQPECGVGIAATDVERRVTDAADGLGKSGQFDRRGFAGEAGRAERCGLRNPFRNMKFSFPFKPRTEGEFVGIAFDVIVLSEDS